MFLLRCLFWSLLNFLPAGIINSLSVRSSVWAGFLLLRTRSVLLLTAGSRERFNCSMKRGTLWTGEKRGKKDSRFAINSPLQKETI